MPRRQLSEAEFNAIKEHVLAAAPRGLSEDDFTKYAGPAFEQAIGQAENSPAPVEGSSLGRFAMGAWQNINPLSLVKAVTPDVVARQFGVEGAGPVAAIKNVVGAQVAQAGKAVDAARQGRISEAVGHGAAALLPVIGPAAANAGEAMASGDLAGGAGQAVGLLAPFAAKYGLQKFSRTKPAQAAVLAREAAQQVSERVLAPGAVKYRGQAQSVAPQILERNAAAKASGQPMPFIGTRAELQQVASEGMDTASRAIDDALTAKGRQTPIDMSRVQQAIRDRIDDLSINGKPITTAADRVEALQQLQTYLKKQPQNLPLTDVLKLRDEWYRAADEAGGYAKMGDHKMADLAAAARDGGAAIRQALIQDVPDLKGVNADFHLYKTISDLLDPSLGRPKTVNAVTSGATGGLHTTGAVIGSMLDVGPLKPVMALIASKLLPAMREAAASPERQLDLANKKYQLADALKAGRIGKAQQILLNLSILQPKGSAAFENTPSFVPATAQRAER